MSNLVQFYELLDTKAFGETLANVIVVAILQDYEVTVSNNGSNAPWKIVISKKGVKKYLIIFRKDYNWFNVTRKGFYTINDSSCDEFITNLNTIIEDL